MNTDSFKPLDPLLYREAVRQALTEDLRSGDITTDATVDHEQKAIGNLVAVSACVLAGLEVAVEAFTQIDPRVEVDRYRSDGDRCQAGECVVRLSGFSVGLLTAERTALNFLQRMSGTATLTRRFVDVADGRTVVLDTRKTTPSLRALQKYSVRAGGGVNHRSALDDGILIKDNHIRLAGSIRVAVERMKSAGHNMPVEVEVASLEEVREALDVGVDIVLVDNMSIADIKEAVRLTRGLAKVEVSGCVTLDRLDQIASIGPEFVSAGALTHSAPAVDFSFGLMPDIVVTV